MFEQHLPKVGIIVVAATPFALMNIHGHAEPNYGTVEVSPSSAVEMHVWTTDEKELFCHDTSNFAQALFCTCVGVSLCMIGMAFVQRRWTRDLASRARVDLRESLPVCCGPAHCNLHGGLLRLGGAIKCACGACA